ncbi:MAG: phosphotransferase [Actinomycetota bacterium]|nr:phosphotransferase [Actinomycetota bacterium]
MPADPVPTEVDLILERAVDRRVLEDPVSPGYSGATLERLDLPDGTRVVIKRARLEADLAMLATDDPGRAYLFWERGIYGRMPASIDCAILAADRRNEEWRMVMRDVSASLVPDNDPVSREDCRRILVAMAQLHAAFAGTPPADCTTIENHLTLFSRDRMRQYASGSNPLPGHALEAWDRFDAVASPALKEAVDAIQAEPRFLADLLRSAGTTLTHADLAFPNIGLADRVVILDFALACDAPGDLDFGIFLVQNDWQIAADPDEIIGDWAEVSGQPDPGALRRALLAAFVEYACWKAPDGPAPYSASFAWWEETALRAWREIALASG